MHNLDDRKLSVMLHDARREAEHPGYAALQPICDVLEAVVRWLAGSHKHERPSLPPRA